MVTVHKVKMAVVGDAPKERTILARLLHLIPSNLGHFQPRLIRKPHHRAFEPAKARRGALKFITPLKKNLVAHADTQKPGTILEPLASRLHQSLLLESQGTVIESSNARQHDARATVQFLGLPHETDFHSQMQKGFVNTPEISCSIVNQRYHYQKTRGT